jgi:hypothetical protein
MHALLRFPGGSCNQKVMDLQDRMSLILKHWKTSSNNHSFHDKSSPICIPLEHKWLLLAMWLYGTGDARNATESILARTLPSYAIIRLYYFSIILLKH